MGVSTAKRAASDQVELNALQKAYSTPGDPRYQDPATAQSIKDIQGTIPYLQNKASQPSPGIGGIVQNPIFRIGLPLALSAFLPGLGTALGSTLLGAGAAGSATLGNALIGAGIGGLTGGGLKGAALGGISGGIGANIGSFGAPGEQGSGILGAAGRNIPGVQSAVQGVSDAGSNIGNGISNVASGIGNFAENNIPGVSTVANGASSLGNSIGNGVSGVGSSIGNALGIGGSSASNASGILTPAENSFLTNATQASGSLSPAESSFLSNTTRSPAIGSTPTATGTVGGGLFGGGSTFNLGGSLASALGGINQNSALKKAQGQLTDANNQQIANLGTFNPSGITSDPGYQFNLDQGNLGLQRMEAAAGGLQSGAALKKAAEFNQNYAGNAFNNYYQRWANQTGAKNQLLANQGQIGATGTVAQGNNLSSALSGALNPTSGVNAQSLLALLQKQNNNPYAGI